MLVSLASKYIAGEQIVQEDGVPLHSSGIWRHDDCLIKVYVLSNPGQASWLGIQIVYWYVEEACNEWSECFHVVTLEEN